MRINNNITAINSHRQYNINSSSISKNAEKLSSGYRVNRAADDAAGLAISEKMRTQIRGLNQASRNSQDGISMIQVAEGALASVHGILQRVRELTVQGANGTNEQIDRNMIALEVWQLSSEIRDMADTIQFNGMKILGAPSRGESMDGIVLQVGANATDTLELDLNLDAMIIPAAYNTNSMSMMEITSRMINHIALALEGSERDDLTNPINDLGTGYSNDQQAVISFFINSQATNAINNISTMRASLGAFQNRLEFKMANLDNTAENITASESRIRDVDMAKMMTEFTKNSILQQASTAMLAQANTLPQGVLQLVG
jgi:flagellin